MPTNDPIRQLNLTRAERDRLTNAAFIDGISMSDLTRSIIDTINGMPDIDKSTLAADPGEITGKDLVRLGFRIDDKPWDEFEEQAYRARTSRSKIFRAYLQQEYGHVPVDRKELVSRA